MSLNKQLYPRCKTYVCHLCHTEDEVCQMATSLIYQVMTNHLSFLPSGVLNEQANKDIVQLELIHDLQPQIQTFTNEFGKIFKRWSKCRQETIQELTKFIVQVVMFKTGTNVVKACGQVTSIISGIIAIGAVVLAPETGGLSLTAWGIRVSLSAKCLMIGADIADSAFTHIQSKRVAEVLERDRKVTEQMEDAVQSLMTTSKLFCEAVDEFKRHNQLFGNKEMTAVKVQELKCEYDQAQQALSVVENAFKTDLLKSTSTFVRGVTGFLIGIYVIKDTVGLIQTIKDIHDGSRSDLQEHIMALTAVLFREHEILEKQYSS